ncbi:C40 family peptidase [Candidatus Blastococcus massiliensis]|uniref:C40 family peptidase n=1 Tax=Candidatus Blastococcus massiliensis TaxID=1470358 RepID=UPI001E4FAB11|nr:C40 family peptidase [Candidatus Blastococcus massiliensis]
MGLELATAPAAAAPGDAATAADAASLVAERGHELEVLTESFNEARENVEAQKAAASAAGAEVARAETQLVALSEAVAGVAQTAYTGRGLGTLQAFMTSGSPDEFLNRVAMLEAVAGHQNDVIDQVGAARAAAEAARRSADQAAVEAQEQVDAAAAKQALLQTEIAAYQAQYEALSAEEQEQADQAHGGRALDAPPPATVTANSEAAQIAVDTAMAQLGDPYVWAAAGPDSFDCSGLTQYAFAAAGIDLPHSSRMQATMGQAVGRADLQPGDLVYFYSPVSHIGIYIGGGKMVHASTFGEPVKVGSVDMAGYVGARRIV